MTQWIEPAMTTERPDDETVARVFKQHDQLVGEIGQLVDDLLKAAALPKNVEPGAVTCEVAALIAVIEYLRVIGVKRRLLQPLVTLFGSLDASKGKPIDEALRWAEAAAAVDILKHAKHIPIEKALQKVARSTNEELSKETLESFRKNIRAGRARDKARDHYDYVLRLDRTSDLPPHEKEARILARIRDLFANSK
jgi:hypothetical protein